VYARRPRVALNSNNNCVVTMIKQCPKGFPVEWEEKTEPLY